MTWRARRVLLPVFLALLGLGTVGSAAAGGEDGSRLSLPTRHVSFRVRVPPDTPRGERVHVLLMPLTDWAWVRHVPLARTAEGVWSGKVRVEEGALVRYAYDRWDGRAWGSAFKGSREAFDDALEIENRHLLVTEDLQLVQDTVAAWADRPAETPRGTIEGRVVDARIGAALVDAEVEAGGLHTATDHDGRFRIQGIAAGRQRVTVHRALGDYRPAAAVVAVAPDGVAQVELALARARPAPVRFEVELPEATPRGAEVRLVANVAQAGARFFHFPDEPENLHLPVLENAGPTRAQITLRLHEGTYVQYFYTVGSSQEGREFDGRGREVYRSFVVDRAVRARRDRVLAWRPPGAAEVTLRVTVPPGTAPDVPVALETGPTHWMTPEGGGVWAFRLYRYPGRLRYRYTLGGASSGAEVRPGARGGEWRTLVVPRRDVVVRDRIRGWQGRPPARPAGGAITFRVSVPASTAPDATVRLVGDVPELAPGVAMRRGPGNPWLYEARVRLRSPGPIRYRYDRGRPGTESAERHRLLARRPGGVVDDWVTRWVDEEAASAARDSFIAGYYLMDFWSPAFLRLSPATFRRIRAHNGRWVALSSAWSYGLTRPLPEVELRPARAGSVSAPRVDVAAQARLAHEAGLRVLLAPQFNMEMSPGGVDAVCGAHPTAWWSAWLGEARRLWLWHARLAREIGAEALLLPGPCFHVFAPAVSFESEADADTFDLSVAELIREVRSAYGGSLVVSGGVGDFDFPGLADLVGVTTYDTGHPELPPDASVEQWRAAYEELFQQELDVIWGRWRKPVLVYQLHLPPHPDDPDPTGEVLQARRLEAFFQALSTRPWVAGAFSWAYDVVDTPLLPSDGLRARLAEAVLAKYYGRLAHGLGPWPAPFARTGRNTKLSGEGP